MPSPDAERARRLRLGCDAAEAALAALATTTSPATWTGPAASTHRIVVEGRTALLRPGLEAARAAAALLVADAGAAEAGGG
jgi:hypothetical protein